MRILYVVHALPAAKLGGTELYTQQLAETVAGDNEVAVATPRGHETDVTGVEVFPLPDSADWTDPTGQASGLTDGVIHEAVDRAFDAVVETFEPDVVHCQHLKFLSASLPQRSADHGISCLLTLHDFWTICHREQLYLPDGTRCSGPDSVAKCTACFAKALDQEGSPDARVDGGGTPTTSDCRNAVAMRTERLWAVLDEVDLLVSPSAFLRERFIRYGVAPERIVQRRNGIRTSKFTDTGFDLASPLRVGYAGRITPRKGIHVLLEAFDRVEDDAELHVFGAFDPDTDPYHARLHERADERVRFHGRYGTASQPYEAVDVFVLPSLWYENSPLVIQEAFASGVPAVVCDVGGMTELVTDGVDGLTFPVGEPAALADHLGRLARSPPLIERLRRGVKSPTSLEEHAEELLSLYEILPGEEADELT